MQEEKNLPKKYNYEDVEPKIYDKWLKMGVFSPEKAQELREEYGLENKDETYSVLMPPPNANAPLHCGHVTYAIQDLYTRWHRMRGYKSLYLPGTDHAGFETQVVYERKLKKEGKSRFDFDRQSLYKKILAFVQKNSETAINQLKKLGISADWNRCVFMLDDNVLDIVYKTFEKMHSEGLIYKDMYMVNYSSYHGTTFSNLETEHVEKVTSLYYVDYQVEGENENITVATVRPETIFADTAIAVNPKDKRYKKYIGKNVINPLNKNKTPVIEDTYVDMEFGTGALKVTPAHDFNDYEIGKKHNLAIPSVIDLEGKMVGTDSVVDGMFVKKARKKVVELLNELDVLKKTDNNYKHNLLVDYKDKLPIEPMLLPNWFVKTEGLADRVIKVVENDEIKFFKKNWKKEMLRWLKNTHDWPISRQIVFGIRIPIWYKINKGSNIFVVFLDEGGNSIDGKLEDLIDDYSLEEISKGLQRLIAPKGTEYVLSVEKPKGDYLQETDTFDTWFSSGQWPLTTLGFSHDGDHDDDFKNYFPTTLMDSMWDILFFWLARMIMFSLYLTDKIPFKNVYIHGTITDENNQKMSKSKGNVIDPLDLVEKYGADALRMGVIVGGNTLARNIALSEDKVRGYRNFANKIWNIARFMQIMESRLLEKEGKSGSIDKNLRNVKAEFIAVADYPTKEKIKELVDILDKKFNLKKEDKKILKDLIELTGEVDKSLRNYRVKDAGDLTYHFIWDRLASDYLERIKDRQDKKVALTVLFIVFKNCLKILHPYMPFVTEKIYREVY